MGCHQSKILFIDRDGTIINEPPDYQIDSLEKLQLEPHVIPALLQLQSLGYMLIMISNQDGLGTPSFPLKLFEMPQQKLLHLLSSQGIHFKDVRICPHFASEDCQCRKPKLGLVLDYIQNNSFDPVHSYVIGDRQTDMQLAKNMGIHGFHYGQDYSWQQIAEKIIEKLAI